jgi:putative transcriptional regulator
MSKKAFDKIAAGLNEALEIARGNAKPSKLYVPAEISVREIRKKLEQVPRKASRRGIP